MNQKERILYLDICDYKQQHICSLYDNASNVSGQASDVYITTERNGWKELSFIIPSVCETPEGSEENHRSEFLKADYLIKTIDDKETDWFIISEPKITHNAYAKTISVTAGHVSQLLKLKNLGLEFSDKEGNNVGTARELGETILSGTGWTLGYVYPFAEKDGSTKYRSLKAPSKSGAFKLISMMCDLFDAKPIYHGDSRTVDIIPMNPFSEPDQGQLPEIPDGSEAIELHYGKNLKNVSRTLNTENIVTKLYAYGSYGDKTSGYCGIDECFHTEYKYTLLQACPAGTVYFFTFKDDAGVDLTYHFEMKNSMAAGSFLTFSLLDAASMLYIWDEQNKQAYPVIKGTNGISLPVQSVEKLSLQNWFQFIMNYDYYREVGLLTDEMIQVIADFQRNAPALHQNVVNASNQMSDSQTELSETIGYIDFCKLDILQTNDAVGGSYLTLTLNKANFSDGVIYRTDYDQNKDNYFEWNTTESLNADGDPINSAASVVYIIHSTDPVTWDKAYIKELDDEKSPANITLWMDKSKIQIDPARDQFFLFSYNGINGRLGVLEANDESAIMALEESTKVVTVDHPVVFTNNDPSSVSVGTVNGYGWLWRYYSDASNFRTKKSELYFAFTDEGDTSWKYVYFLDSEPTSASNGMYWFDWRNSVLYRYQESSDNWIALNSSAEEKVAALFSTVYTICKNRDKYYQGLYEKYTYSVPSGATLQPGNYFIQNEYDSYWAFTTTEALSSGDTLSYDYEKAWITQTKGGISTTLKPKNYRFDNVNYHSSNVLRGISLESGSIDRSNGKLIANASACRTSNYISVVPSTQYIISGVSKTFAVHFYNDKKNWVSFTSASSGFTTPANVSYIRLAVDVPLADFTQYENMSVYAVNSSGVIIIEDLNYTKLNDVSPSGKIIGLVQCISDLKSLANWTYGTYYDMLKEAQSEIENKEKEMTSVIGDLYREGWWQDSSYVDGDEDKLYTDATDNLNQIAKPEAAYSITYLDLFNANEGDSDFGAAEESVAAKWPEVSISSAIHLVDQDIAVNTWAFVDKIQKCYDKPWQTKISINTNLSTIAQHSFTDVMSNIASVASELKGKTSYYDKTLGGMLDPKLVVQLAANVVATERDFNSTYSRMEQREDSTIKRMTTIAQDADEIRVIAESTSTALGDIDETVQQAMLKIDPEKIMGIVEESVSYQDLVDSFGTASDAYNSAAAEAGDAKNNYDNAKVKYDDAAALYGDANQKANDAANSAAAAKGSASTAQSSASAARIAAESAEAAVADAVTAAESRNKIFAQDNEPTNAAVNDLWIDTNDGNKLWRYTSSGWKVAQDTSFAKASALTATKDDITAIVGLKVTDETTGKETIYAGSVMKQQIDNFYSAIYDGTSVKSILSQTDKAIVNAVQANGSNMFNSIAVTDAGVDIKSCDGLNMKSGSDLNIESGADLIVKSGGIMTVNSGGAMNIESGGNIAIKSGGTFTVDSGNFDLDSKGKVYASGAVINGQISSGGYPVLTKGYDIYVGSSEPTSKHVGMLWIKPGKPSSDSEPEEQTSVITSYEYNIPYTSRSYVGSSASDSNYYGTLNGSGMSFDASTCTYSASVPVYLRPKSGSSIGCTLCLKISNGVHDITLRKDVTEANGSYQVVSFFDDSINKWIGTGSTLYFWVYAETLSGYDRGNVLNSRDTTLKVIVTCSAKK